MENDITKKIQIALSAIHSRLFRNNTGTGWVGKKENRQNGIFIENPRPLKAGLHPGSSDLIGWTVKEITPDMVGSEVAIFTAIEVKSPGGRLSQKQILFIKRVREDGGLAFKAESDQEAMEKLTTQLNESYRAKG
ncbi:MAG: VRR-NUC domain-containing protein [Endozoicomonas sp.]